MRSAPAPTGSAARVVVHLVVLVALVAAALVGASPRIAVAAYATPTGLTTVSRATTSLSVGWTATPGAPRYRVQYSASPTMSNATYRRSYTTRADLTGLKPGRTYYYKVRVISADGGTSLTPYSSARSTTTWSAGDTLTRLNPADFSGRAASPTSLDLRWSSRGSGVNYRVQYSRSSTMANPVYKRFTTVGGTLSGLEPGTAYYLKVTVTDTAWQRLSDYSPAIRVATTTVRPPAGVTVVSRSRTGLAVTWRSVADADRYRIRYATSSSMSNAASVQITGTRADLTGLVSNRDYYLQVRGLAADGSALTDYSSTVRATTRSSSSSATALSPAGFTVVPEPSTPSNAVRFSWQSRGGADLYRVRVSTRSDMSSPDYLRVTASTGAMGGLKPGDERYVQVAVASSGWDTISDYTPAVRVRTLARDIEAPSVSHPLRVASYHVGCYLCTSGDAPEFDWADRKASVAKVILNQEVDVIGVQEASQGAVVDPTTGVSSPQFLQLRDALGSPFKVTNEYRYNCERSTSSNNCTPVNRGASQGTRIYYNSQRVRLISQGSRRLSELVESHNDRYLAWAIFEQVSSGKRFLFGNAHLEGTDDSGSSTAFHDLRVTQAREALQTLKSVNSAGLPVIMVGDLNSSRWGSPTNGPYDVFLGAGLVDHLGAAHRTTWTQPGADVEHRIDTWFSTYNNWKSVPSRSEYLNGSAIDYILTTPMRMAEYENVLNLDPSSGAFVPVIAGSKVRIPSDHNLQRATLQLP